MSLRQDGFILIKRYLEGIKEKPNGGSPPPHILTKAPIEAPLMGNREASKWRISQSIALTISPKASVHDFLTVQCDDFIDGILYREFSNAVGRSRDVSFTVVSTLLRGYSNFEFEDNCLKNLWTTNIFILIL